MQIQFMRTQFPGTYTVNLTVSNGNSFASKTATITVLTKAAQAAAAVEEAATAVVEAAVPVVPLNLQKMSR